MKQDAFVGVFENRNDAETVEVVEERDDYYGRPEGALNPNHNYVIVL